jgi:hypothetical protein
VLLLLDVLAFITVIYNIPKIKSFRSGSF